MKLKPYWRKREIFWERHFYRKSTHLLQKWITVTIHLLHHWYKAKARMGQGQRKYATDKALTHTHTLNFGLWSFFQEIGSRSLHTFYAHWHSNGEARVHVLKKEDFQPWSWIQKTGSRSLVLCLHGLNSTKVSKKRKKAPDSTCIFKAAGTDFFSYYSIK